MKHHISLLLYVILRIIFWILAWTSTTHLYIWKPWFAFTFGILSLTKILILKLFFFYSLSPLIVNTRGIHHDFCFKHYIKYLFEQRKKKIINSFLNFYQINSIFPITFFVVHWPPNSIALFPYPAFYIMQTHLLFHKSRFSLTLPSLSTHKWWSHIHRFSWWGFRWNHRWGSGTYVKTWKLHPSHLTS